MIYIIVEKKTEANKAKDLTSTEAKHSTSTEASKQAEKKIMICFQGLVCLHPFYYSNMSGTVLILLITRSHHTRHSPLQNMAIARSLLASAPSYNIRSQRWSLRTR